MGWFLLIILVLFVSSCSLACKDNPRAEIDKMKPTDRAVYEKMIW
jgi:hypothetical protein